MSTPRQRSLQESLKKGGSSVSWVAFLRVMKPVKYGDLALKRGDLGADFILRSVFAMLPPGVFARQPLNHPGLSGPVKQSLHISA